MLARASRVRIPSSPPSVFADGKAAIMADLTTVQNGMPRLCGVSKQTGVSMFYVYILQSINTPDSFYIGFTTDLKKRLQKHNTGNSVHTNKFKPWKIKNYFAFDDEQKAKDFESYLKTHAGRKFCKNHF